jgi:hypothetical protein
MVPMAAPPPTEPATRGVAGTRFVVLAVIAMALFVTFILVGSPVLLERTLERVPPPAPHAVEAGEGWEAIATQADEDTACLEVRVGAGVSTDCVGPRGLPLRLVDARPLDDGHVVYGIVDPRTSAVTLELREGGPIVVDVSYVDFGFPLGFFATELRPDTVVEGLVARDEGGEARAAAVCGTSPPTASGCAVEDLR